MKISYIALSLCLCASGAFCSTLQEDYQEIAPQMEMLNIQSAASVGLLEPLIEKGNSVAMYLAASMYEEGKAVEKDEKKAFELYLKSAEKNPLSQMAVANMYANGRGTEISADKAIAYYEKVLSSDDEKLKDEAKDKIAKIKAVQDKENTIKETELRALAADPESMLEMAEFCVTQENFTCAYVWLTLSYNHPAMKANQDDLLKAIKEVAGQMTMPQLMEGAKKVNELQPILQKNEK